MQKYQIAATRTSRPQHALVPLTELQKMEDRMPEEPSVSSDPNDKIKKTPVESESDQVALEKTNKQRFDRFKQPIMRGQKGHAIVFRDRVDNQLGLADVVVVESWKRYNLPYEEDGDSETCCRQCVLI